MTYLRGTILWVRSKSCPSSTTKRNTMTSSRKRLEQSPPSKPQKKKRGLGASARRLAVSCSTASAFLQGSHAPMSAAAATARTLSKISKTLWRPGAGVKGNLGKTRTRRLAIAKSQNARRSTASASMPV